MNKRAGSVILRLSLFAIGGACFGWLLGTIFGFSWQDNDGSLLIFPIIICTLNGTFIAWFFRKTTLSFQLLFIVFFGLAIGSIVGATLGGMVGTILSIPFENWWESLFIAGNILGAIIIGTTLPIFILRKFQTSNNSSTYFKKSEKQQ